MVKRHVWVVEWREPKCSRLWSSHGLNNMFTTKKLAVADARELTQISKEFGYGTEHRVVKYTPHDPLERYSGGY